MTDERQGLPSASSFHMDVACPGRQNLLRSLLPHELAPEPENDYAARGTRIHHALQTGDVSQLDEGEMEDYNKCLKIEVAVFNKWREELQSETQSKAWEISDSFS